MRTDKDILELQDTICM